MQIFKSKMEKVQDLLIASGAKDIKHVKFGSLYDHLLRVSTILKSWELDDNIQMAGMLHSVYNTEYFKGNLLSIDKEKVLQDIVGGEVNDIIKAFAELKRDTLKKNEYTNSNKNSFIYKKYYKDEVVEVDEYMGVALSHIMLANDLDHLEIFTFGNYLSEYKKYANVYTFLSPLAKRDLFKIIKEQDLISFLSKGEEATQVATATEILFTGHSGLNIKNNQISIAIDPWLYSSTHSNPIINGLDPSQYTIDYMIPEPKNCPIEISPNVILLSHFHTHHSPLREIIDFAKINPIKIYCPPLDDNKLERIKQKMGDYIFNRITFIFNNRDFETKEGGALIKGFVHYAESKMPHFIYYVRLNNKSLLHIVDAKSSRENMQSLEFDDHWKRLDDLAIDYLFVGGAGHIMREIVDNQRVIFEAVSLTPAQAAKLANRWQVKYAGLIGMYNHSIWDDRVEMGLSIGEAESQFYFTLTWLAPAIKIIYPRPGNIY